MWYVYVLKSIRTGKLYTGYTSNVERRLEEHNSKRGGDYTSKNAPFYLVYFEAFVDKRDAIKEEKILKSGKGREFLEKKIVYSKMVGQSA